jgi:very-short-patch-repair endonuclease
LGAGGQPRNPGLPRSPPSSHPIWGPGGSPAIQAYREALQAATPFGGRGAAPQSRPTAKPSKQPPHLGPGGQHCKSSLQKIKNQNQNQMKSPDLTMHYGAPPEIFKRAKQLRRRMTSTEEKLWNFLKDRRELKLTIRRQHPAFFYILDFYCHQARLGIEIDGKYHESQKQIKYDEKRTAQLNELGIEIIRYTNEQILEDFDNTGAEILNIIKERIKRIEAENE